MKTNLTHRFLPRSLHCRIGFTVMLLLSAIAGLAAPSAAGGDEGIPCSPFRSHEIYENQTGSSLGTRLLQNVQVSPISLSLKNSPSITE